MTVALACATPEPPPYSIVTSSLSCERVQQLAAQVVGRLGYRVTKSAPTTGNDEIIKGARQGAQGEETVSVKITCGPNSVQVDANPDVSPCEQANRITRQAVERLGYTVTSFVPAATGGSVGVVKGKKTDGEKPDTVMLSITCTHEAVYVDTRSDNPVVMGADFTAAISDFRRGFFTLFKPLADKEQSQQNADDSR